MSLRGQCTICYSAFTPTTVSALPCGHTFHARCIGKWLDTPGRGCPNCRRKCRAKDVTRIFFENGGLNDTLNGTTPKSGEEALLAKNKALKARLNDVTAESNRKNKALKELLQAKHLALDAEKKKCREMAQDLEAKKKRLSELEIGVGQGHLLVGSGSLEFAICFKRSSSLQRKSEVLKAKKKSTICIKSNVVTSFE
ncbi:unnamed protein product, partial [Mesorhabditis belari]|uniref:RING-type domain-containing protein n=1 Tax=Mesorhabditis belari TaxID=2138241 RepID=A0AAF3JB30_9BILA